jgi:hypothetical protein
MNSYIQLIVPHKLEKEIIKRWFACVEQCLPSGMIGSTTIVVDKKTKETNIYSKVLENKKICYIIPLVRNCDSSEIHELVQHWIKRYPTGDFIIDYSQQDNESTNGSKSIEEKKINEVLDAWAKKEHKRWMDDCIKQGWKYGVKMSTVKKTHPWLQPWEMLPENAKEQKKQSVKDLLKLLNDFGYTIIQKPEA